MKKLIALWAHPRSLSTALERIMIERGDLNVVHEPFSALYYLSEKKADAVGAKFEADQARSYGEIRDDLIAQTADQPVLFKDMCYHCFDHVMADTEFLKTTAHIFLIRDPEKSIASHFAKNPDVTNEEIGYEAQSRVFDRVLELQGSAPVVDADDLTESPKQIAEALFAALDLPPRPEALEWEPGHRPEWDNWKDWHVEVAGTGGIERRKSEYADTIHNNEKLAAFDQHHRPFYHHMFEHRIQPKP